MSFCGVTVTANKLANLLKLRKPVVIVIDQMDLVIDVDKTWSRGRAGFVWTKPGWLGAGPSLVIDGAVTMWFF